MTRAGIRKMEERSHLVQILTLASLLLLFPLAYGWGKDGHYMVCKIAESRLSEAAASAVKELVPDEDELASWCSWADNVKFRYPWSRPLHYINTPDSLCTYKHDRDCMDEDGEMDRCVAGAITNYTTQLSSSQAEYNLTEALLFLAHYMGDVHQPLHVGFTSDKGGNTIDVHWYTRKQVLHHVWDNNIIETAEERFYDSDVDELVDAIERNITTAWSDLVTKWETCAGGKTTCPDIYASEGIKAACDWAYKGASEGTTLEDDYFLSRLPIVTLKLAQAGVRLAAALNRIFQ